MRTSRRSLLTAGAVLAALAVLAVGACAGEDSPAGTDDSRTAAAQSGIEAVPRVAARLGPSVVAVSVASDRGTGEGSGVIWSSDGAVVTNHHVVAAGGDTSVTLASGAELPAEVVATDPLTDLAVLRVERDDLPAAPFARGLPTTGQLAVALGNPLGFEHTVTAGVVSGLDRALPTGGRTPALVGLLQTDAPISPGNSGGALANASGEVIGINVAYLPPQAQAVSIGFAIPAPVVREVIPELLEDARVEHAYLGLSVVQLTAAVSREFGLDVEKGALIASIASGGPAAATDLRRGDVIVAAADEEIAKVEDLYSALREANPGDRMPLTIVRDGRRIERTVSLAARPANG